MSISDFEVADFSLRVTWSKPIALPVREFKDSFIDRDFDVIEENPSEPAYVYTNEDMRVEYDLEASYVEVTPMNVGDFGASADLLSSLLDEWDTTVSSERYLLRGQLLAPYDGEDEDAGDLLIDTISGPEMIDNLKGPKAGPITWRYSNTHRENVDPVIDVRIEPYIENPEYFHITIRKSSVSRDQVWSVAENLEATLEELITSMVS